MKNYTKAEALKFLISKSKKNNSLIVPKLIFFEKGNYLKNKEAIIRKILKNFSSNIIIRSSAKEEDSLFSSLAGKYRSFEIKTINKKIIEKNINLIVKDFKNNKDQIIVQDLIKEMDLSGVIFTKDPKTSSDYYIINYDTSGKTNLITSGTKNLSMKTNFTFKKEISYSQKFGKILKKIKFIEKIFENDCLDIEFGIKKNKLYIFQCRPLVGQFENLNIEEHLKNIKKKIIKINHNPILYGEKTILSNMADWNPAEMIGSLPKPLAISLYSELITNEVWANQRQRYGYLDVRPNALMYNLYGKPYIDVRTDFNSFLPKNLLNKLSKKILNNRIKFLSQNKHLHDKIEFDVIETCFNFSSKKNILKYLSVKDANEYIKQLKSITEKIINQNFLSKEKKIIDEVFKSIKDLKRKKLSHIQNVFFLIQICKKEGILPFSGLARCAFIGTSILNSLKDINILSNNDVINLYESIDTISKKIKTDSSKIWKNASSKRKFLEKYGHLRPLTYSISSKNYRENLKKYFPKNTRLKKTKYKKFQISKLKYRKIDYFIKKESLDFSANELIKFIKESIKLREYGKYVFSKCVDEIFTNLIELAKEIKIKRDEVEYIDINSIIKSYNNLKSDKLAYELKKQIKENQIKENISKKINLPDVITSEREIYSFETSSSKGNFFSDKNVTSICINYKENLSDEKLKNKIIMIENADPGYDFIFNKNISGLITKYGGANSHMSIRCMEENLPACIGVGETQFNVLQNSKIIELNCNQKIINIIS